MIKYLSSFFNVVPSFRWKTRNVTKFRLSCGQYSKTIYLNNFYTIEEIINRVNFYINHMNLINSNEFEIYAHHFTTKEQIIISDVVREQRFY
jgi:hypothetical protein